MRSNTLTAYLSAAALLAAVTSAAGCDWRKFDDLADQTWVDVSSSPDPLTSRFYGAAIATPGNQGDGANILVVGRSGDGVGHMLYAADGSKDTTGTTLENFAPEPLPQRPAFAGDPVAGFAVLAVPATPRLVIALFGSNGNLASSQDLDGLEPVTALGIGATDSDGNGNATTDAVYTRGLNVEVKGNYADAPIAARQCQYGGASGLSVTVSDLDGDAGNGEEIVIASAATIASDPSTLIIMRGSVIEAAHVDNIEVDCFADGRVPLMTIPAPGGEPDFGTAVAVGHFDGNTTPDLAVSAPSANKVYIFFDVDAGAATSASMGEIPGETTSSEFGLSIAAGDLDDDGSDELVIGDRSVAHDGKNGAGSAYIYSFGGTTASDATEMFDFEPVQDAHYGTTVAVVPFGSRNIAVIGSDGEVFTYFRTLVSDDVRVR